MNSADGGESYESTADLYDHVVPYRKRPDVSFYVEAATEAGSPVLEVGCGTGRVLIPTALAGTAIVGLDMSPHMLAVCRRRLREEDITVQHRAELVQADMRQFDLDRLFTLAMIPFRPFQHLLTVDEQLSCLASIWRHLVDGGRLVFDVFNPFLEWIVATPSSEEGGDEPEFATPDGRRVMRKQRTLTRDRVRQVDQHELIYYVTYPDGRQERVVHAFPLRYLFRFEVEHLLARAGFQLEHLYAGFDKSPYGSTYPGDLVCVARRVGTRTT